MPSLRSGRLTFPMLPGCLEEGSFLFQFRGVGLVGFLPLLPV